MFQSFDAPTTPEQGPPRLAALREEMAREGLAGYLVPRADAHQGEYVSPRDARLQWLTGFTGSAGFCAVLADRAGVFVDGRYRVQVRAQVADAFTPVNWPEVKLGDWLARALPDGGRVGFDPWLHTVEEIANLETRLAETGITLVPGENLIDRIWTDQPPRPCEPVIAYPVDLAGKGDETKRADIAAALIAADRTAAVLTLPDSICWLLNIRGTDIPRNPVVQAFAILHDDGRVALFSDPEKFDALGPDPHITLNDWDAFAPALAALSGPVQVDRDTAPLAVSRILKDAGIRVDYAPDPCLLPKACKNDTEIAASRTAHLRDGAAMVEFLCWLDAEAPKGKLSEIDVVTALEDFRRATGKLRDISFDTISGAGPNGAIVHYKVTTGTNRPVTPGELLLIDSGAQYLDGTTDITRTVATGPASDDERACFTRVLKGMIAISRARWPVGLTGRDLDPLARIALWRTGHDFDHGTGHGVGAYLSVHEGPARISRKTDVVLQPGMILSNEPGYYREGSFGIRIENLCVIRTAPDLPGGDARAMLDFETLTLAPIDTRLIAAEMLDADERAWLNAYHRRVLDDIGPLVSPTAQQWLARACAPI